MLGLHNRLKLGSSLAAFVSAMPLLCSAAYAQQADDDIETVVVTGTSIRGVAPIGSNLITMDS